MLREYALYSLEKPRNYLLLRQFRGYVSGNSYIPPLLYISHLRDFRTRLDASSLVAWSTPNFGTKVNCTFALDMKRN